MTTRPPWSDTLARMMFEQSPFSTVLYDPQGHIIAANAAFEELWAVDIANAPADYCVLTDPELERQGATELIRRAFAGEAVTTPTIRYDIAKLSVGGAGRVRWTRGHFQPLLDEDGVVKMVVLTHIDLTDRVEAEVRLRYAVNDLETLQALTVALATAISVDEVAGVALELARPAFGAGGGFVTVVDGSELAVVRYEGLAGESFSKWTRFPLDSELPSAVAVRSREPVYSFGLDAARARYPAVVETLIASGYRSFVTLPLQAHGDPIGTIVYHFTVDNPLTPAQQQTLLTFAGQCALAMERAQLYESERRARSEAEAANRAKSDFLATMSHELRTPLNAIDGYAELLELGIRGQLNEAQLNDILRIRRSQKHLLSLIDDVLNFARIESGTIALNVHPVDLAVAVASASEVVTPQLQARRLLFSSDVVPDELYVAADADKLQQILVNLLANAVKFTEEGGITVEVRRDTPVVKVDITDTGRGIPAARLADIFDPFVQVESGTTRTTSGTGLGLAIARDFARRMGGDITARSVPGAGSTFTITLPLAEKSL